MLDWFKFLKVGIGQLSSVDGTFSNLEGIRRIEASILETRLLRF